MGLYGGFMVVNGGLMGSIVVFMVIEWWFNDGPNSDSW